MSRIGRQPVTLPQGVEVKVRERTVEVKGPKGSLQRTFPDQVEINVDGDVATVTRINEERLSRALHGLSRALLANMVQGVAEGFTKTLKIVGVGYRAAKKGNDVELQVGFSHPVSAKAPAGIEFEVPDPTTIVVAGIDKELVGEVAATIRKIRPPEPYKGKGIRYADEYVRRKAGKAGVAR